MNKPLLLLLFFCLAFITTQAQHTLTATDVTFNTSSKTITAYTNEVEKNIIIPASFNIGGQDYPVVHIYKDAFREKELTHVVLPNTIVSIGSHAFYHNQIATISLPNSVETIGQNAFLSNEITTLTLPALFKFTGTRAFNLNQINMINGQPSNGLIFARNEDGTEDQTKVISYGGASHEIDFIPNTVKTLGKDLFNSFRIDKLVFPTALETIEDRALRWCDLTEVVIPNTVKYIGETAFAYNKLSSVTIGDAVETIDHWSFHSNEITEITIPPSVKTIGRMAFYKNKLTNVNIGNTVTELNDGCFTTNEIVTVNNLPSKGVFYARNSDGSEDMTRLASYGGTAKNIDFLPNSIITIGSYAFDSSYITSITFPNALKTIGSRAFYANSLSEVNLPQSIETIGSIAFAASGVSSVPLPAKSIIGYTGYWTNKGSDPVTEITEFYYSADYRKTPIDYSITYNMDGGTHANPSQYNIETEEITLTDASKAGYDFSGWYTEASFTNEITSIPQGSVEDIELWAKFDITTNMDESSSANKLNIYPTIATNRINIKGNINLEDIYIFSTTGALAKRLMATSAQEIIYVGDLNNGTYIVKIGNTTRKIIIRR